MLKIEGKTFMNIQEAVQWLLDNNALPFQSSADYQANTEIGLGTIVNPSPAKVRIGSLIFFADSKVSTVVGITETGFICSDQYNDLVDDIVYVSNVALNASGHLIVTLSNGDNIDAGLIKQVSSFSINASQHLIANYNDGTSTDLGAIFSGNITVSGNLTVSGGISGNAITGDSIIENMAGYSATLDTGTGWTYTFHYVGVSKTGNKLTFAVCATIQRTAGAEANPSLLRFTIPSAVGAKLYPVNINGYDFLSLEKIAIFQSSSTVKDIRMGFRKTNNTSLYMNLYTSGSDLVDDTAYFLRFDVTFLLSENLAS